jgi:hypothetical protein
MSVGMITFIIWFALLLLLLTGFPIAFCMIGIGVVGFFVFVGSKCRRYIFLTGMNYFKQSVEFRPLFAGQPPLHHVLTKEKAISNASCEDLA